MTAIAGDLRARAKAVRAGDAPPTLRKAARALVKTGPERVPLTQVFLLKKAKWIEGGQVMMAREWTDVPVSTAIAARAIELGVAVAVGDPKAKDLRKNMQPVFRHQEHRQSHAQKMPWLQDTFPGDPQRAWQRRANPVLIGLLHFAPEFRTPPSTTTSSLKPMSWMDDSESVPVIRLATSRVRFRIGTGRIKIRGEKHVQAGVPGIRHVDAALAE